MDALMRGKIDRQIDKLMNEGWSDSEIVSKVLSGFSEKKGKKNPPAAASAASGPKTDSEIIQGLKGRYITYTLSVYFEDTVEEFKARVLEAQGEYRPELHELSDAGWQKLYDLTEQEI